MKICKIYSLFVSLISWVLVFSVASGSLWAKPTDLQTLNYGMSYQEVGAALGKQIRTNGFEFLVGHDRYFLDVIKDKSLRFQFEFLFKNERLYSVNESVGIIHSKFISCVVEKPYGQPVITSDCLETELAAAVSGQINLPNYRPTAVNRGSWAAKLFYYVLVAPIVIVILPFVLLWAWDEQANSDKPTHQDLRKGKSIFDVPKLGDQMDMDQVCVLANRPKPVGKNLTVAAFYVKEGKAAFGIENDQINWVLDCKFYGNIGVCYYK
jgi:hypothetical protein